MIELKSRIALITSRSLRSYFNPAATLVHGWPLAVLRICGAAPSRPSKVARMALMA
jgi:hypothetical protein